MQKWVKLLLISAMYIHSESSSWLITSSWFFPHEQSSCYFLSGVIWKISGGGVSENWWGLRALDSGGNTDCTWLQWFDISNQYLLDNEYWKLLFLTMTLNFHQILLLNLLRSIDFNARLAVQTARRAMGKQNVLYKQLS